MKVLIASWLSLILMSEGTEILSIVDFGRERAVSDWIVVNDGVMGGLSQGRFYLNHEQKGIFEGHVSLENNGGFSMVRHRFTEKSVGDYSMIRLKVKGDGKRYQFRVKTDYNDRHSYVQFFETDGDWQTIEIDLSSLYPAFRGRKMAMPNYPGEAMEEIAILIGNKKDEDFRLEIDSIVLL
jgi:hypothetical protein